MEQYTYYGGQYDDDIKPKYPVSYMMMETYFKNRIDQEVERMMGEMDRKIAHIGVQSITEINNLKKEIIWVKNKLDKKEKKEVKEPPKDEN